MPYTKKTWEDRIVDAGGAVIQPGTPVSAGNMNRIEQGVADAHAALEGANRQAQTIGQGVTVLNAAMNAPVNVEVKGRTLTSLGNSKLDSTKYHVLSAKRTKVKMESGNVYQGVAKIYAESGQPQIMRIANFEDKVSGSTLENPHIAKFGTPAALQSPSSANLYEVDSANYGRLSTINNSTLYAGSATNGNSAQELFSFNLIEEVERHIGTIPRPDVAGKVQWLKDSLVRHTVKWNGFGSSPAGNKATLSRWDAVNSVWITQASHGGSTISLLSAPSTNIITAIDANGFMHFLAHAEPSDGTTASTISTDYIDLEIELKAGADFHEPSIPLYEVEAADYAKILVEWNEEEVRRRYPAAKGTEHINGLAIIAEGENLLPPFSEWTLNTNAARIIGPYELELNATVAGQSSFVEIKTIVGQTYTVDAVLSAAGCQIEIWDSANVKKVDTRTTGKTFTATTTSAKVYVTNATTSLFNFKNIILTVGSIIKPFVPRNPSMLLAPTKLGAIGAVRDLLFKQDGVWKRRKAIEKDVSLDGSLGWGSPVDFAGFKEFLISIPNGAVSSQIVSKYNGAILGKASTASSADTAHLTANYLYLRISDTDSGFTETYTPTASEIKAFFNGWKASTVDANGKPTAWVSVVDGSTAPTQTLAYVSANLAPSYTPYKLSYVLATPVIETVSVEGDIVANGPTQIEVTAGVIVREKVTPSLNAGIYRINDRREPVSSHTSYRSLKHLQVFKGSVEDSWGVNASSFLSNGLEFLSKPQAGFDPTADYYVTYLAYNRQLLTVNPLDVDTSFAQNVRSAVDDLVAKTGDTAATVTVHATLLYDVMKRLKAGGL